MDPTDELIRCGSCGFHDAVDAFDICGACPGNLFCRQCSAEVEAETGNPALMCGECDHCQAMISDGLWEQEQAYRSAKRIEAM